MKRVLNRTLSMVLMAGFVGAPVMTALAQEPSEAQAGKTQPAARGFESLSKQDLKELADYGARRGEDVSDLRAYAEGNQRALAEGEKRMAAEGGKQAAGGFLFKIKKKALILLIDRGGRALDVALSRFPKASKPVKKYKSKVIEAVKKLPEPNEGMIRTALIAVGVEQGDAMMIAPWIHYML
jgi:hypothetical protein